VKWNLRKPCARCGGTTGRIQPRNGQDCVYCDCGAFQYNAPRTETGKRQRSVSTVHRAISAKQRARIVQRATGRCEICGSRGILHVGHLLSVKRALELGLGEAEINSDENLAAMCEECNLGIGEEPVPLRLAVAIVMARIRKGRTREQATSS